MSHKKLFFFVSSFYVQIIIASRRKQKVRGASYLYGQTYIRTYERPDGHKDVWADRQTHKDRRTQGRMNGQTDIRTYEWTDGQNNRKQYKDRKIGISIYLFMERICSLSFCNFSFRICRQWNIRDFLKGKDSDPLCKCACCDHDEIAIKLFIWKTVNKRIKEEEGKSRQ